MKLSEQEHKYVRKMAHLFMDSRIADELTRIRVDLGIKDKVTAKQVLCSRHSQNIKKKRGQSCQVEKKKEN